MRLALRIKEKKTPFNSLVHGTMMNCSISVEHDEKQEMTGPQWRDPVSNLEWIQAFLIHGAALGQDTVYGFLQSHIVHGVQIG